MEMKKVKCPLCHKEFEGKQADGSLRLHLMQLHKATSKQVEERKEVTETNVGKEKNWRWLNRKNKLEYKAFRAGYNQICNETGDIR